jgi:hypothetical protein
VGKHSDLIDHGFVGNSKLKQLIRFAKRGISSERKFLKVGSEVTHETNCPAELMHLTVLRSVGFNRHFELAMQNVVKIKN